MLGMIGDICYGNEECFGGLECGDVGPGNTECVEPRIRLGTPC